MDALQHSMRGKRSLKTTVALALLCCFWGYATYFVFGEFFDQIFGITGVNALTISLACLVVSFPSVVLGKCILKFGEERPSIRRLLQFTFYAALNYCVSYLLIEENRHLVPDVLIMFLLIGGAIWLITWKGVRQAGDSEP